MPQILINRNLINIIKREDDNSHLSCSLFELLEIWSMHQADVYLIYIDDKGNQIESHGKNSNVFSRNGEEQIGFNKILNFPTKRIISVNDTKFRDYLK